MSTTRHGQCIVNDVRLHYVEAGPSDGDLVICLHGFPEFWYSWHRQLPALAGAGYRVIAPDMRGYNRSEKPHGVGAYSLEELTADVRGLVTQFGAEQAHIVGHDWGGVVAWATAYRHPDVVRSLTVLNAPHPLKYARELSLEQLGRSWYALFFQLPWLPERLFRARDFALLEELFTDERVSPEAFSPTDIDRYKDAFRHPGAVKSAISYYRALFRGTALTELPNSLPFVGSLRTPTQSGQVRAPTLVIWGENDVALTTAQLEGLETYVSDLQIERFPNASHWVNADRPEAVNEALCGFLERVDQS